MSPKSEQEQPPRQFGIFYPRGYVVVALQRQADAERLRQLLVDGGYDEEDVRMLDTAQVLAGASADLENLSPFIKALGSEAGATKSHLEGAAKGQTFLVVYAPSELDTERLMNVARRVGYVAAQKYDRFSITRL
jgi:hypothetical protein